MADSSMAERRVEFIGASTWHGTADRADAMMAAHPELAGSDIHIAAILGDDAGVRMHLARDPGCVNGRSDPYGADPLTHLCLSKYLRLDPARTDAFLRAATALLDAGADPNAGFWTTGDHPEHETPLYGARAAADAHHCADARMMGGEPCIRGMRVTRRDDCRPRRRPDGPAKRSFASIRTWRLTILPRRCPMRPGARRKSKCA